MKKIKLSRPLYYAAVILPLVLVILALALAYVRSGPGSRGQLSPKMGTAQAQASWKVHLKENPFYPTLELGSEYAYITELVENIQFDLSFALDGAPQDAPVTVDYRADGVLRANNETDGGAPLLKQEYPQLDEASKAFTGPGFTDTQSFQLSLKPYTYVIDSFKSAYRLGAAASFELNIAIKVAMEAGGRLVTGEIPLRLNIPLDETVFQISGTSSGTAELEGTAVGVDAQKTAAGALPWLILAGMMLLIGIAGLVFLEPERADPGAAQLKQALNKCKGVMVGIQADPREGVTAVIPVMDIAGLLSVSEENGQPVLYRDVGEVHSFFVMAAGAVYFYEIKLAGDLPPQQSEQAVKDESAQ
jgi:hypothetical protein